MGSTSGYRISQHEYTENITAQQQQQQQKTMQRQTVKTTCWY
jgi:hypothetical protein